MFIILQIVFRNMRDLPVFICQSRGSCQLASKIPTSFYIQISLQSKGSVLGKSTTFERKTTCFNSIKDKLVADEITRNL